jgi:hypothetical protein
MGYFSDLQVQQQEEELAKELKQEQIREDNDKEFERRAHDLDNRTITMESTENVWAWREIIRQNATDNKIVVEVWGRDCDQAESSNLCTLDASIDALATLVDNVQEKAEGPWGVTVMTPSEVNKNSREDRYDY